jgi:hypothetical protein
MNNLPDSTKVFPLQAGSKVPRPGSRGHFDAKPLDQFNFSVVPEYYNYGISLDGQYACLDIDDPDKFHLWREANGFDIPVSWNQKTRRGTHYLFKWTGGGTNQKLEGADLKVRGYIVGPGSIVKGYQYTYIGGDVVEPTGWIVEALQRDPEPIVPKGVEANGIASGEHNEALFRMSCWLRGQYNLSEEAIETFLKRGPMSILKDYDPERPFTERELKRIARSAAGYDIEEKAILASSLRRGSDVREYDDDVRFILPGFVPIGALTILYGDGKIGKSSWLSWLAARESKHANVIFIPSGEETFEQFVRRCRLNGANDSNLYEYVSDGPLLPKRTAALEKAVSTAGNVSLIVIDALYSHFESSSGENEATRARSKLTPLAEFAREYNIAVVGTIHENAGGGLLGSREMRNVCRSMIHAVRKGKGPLTIWSEGANAWSPDYGVTFPGTAIPNLDRDGNPVVFKDLFGEDVYSATWKLDLGGKAGEEKPDSGIVYEDGIPRTGLDEIYEPTIEDHAVYYLRRNPGATWKEVADGINASHTYIRKIGTKIRERVDKIRDFEDV